MKKTVVKTPKDRQERPPKKRSDSKQKKGTYSQVLFHLQEAKRLIKNL